MEGSDELYEDDDTDDVLGAHDDVTASGDVITDKRQIRVTKDMAEVLDKTIALLKAKRQAAANVFSSSVHRIRVTAMSEEFWLK